MSRRTYVVIGYDLSGNETEKFNEWRWTKEGEKFLYYQRKGYIQLIDDYEYKNFLFFGYILSVGDDDDYPTISFSVDELQKLINDEDVGKKVEKQFEYLCNIGVIECCKPKMKIHCFEVVF